MMPRYKVMATEYVYKDAYVDAKDAQEAYEKAKGDVDWKVVGGDFEVHADMTFKETDDKHFYF